ncbi:ferric-dicitrate binding protein FerR (iron transport regulator) [Filimonas zeae]|uniref:Iron dicitrate transporter FecR n=1 Tax=Filimonas zeae TaxID=1737353 RepID=A0A917IVY0_9BACT|nr:FecR family protein [Filimonas zeae]MDR6339482.1 ferric-dicitrate binding protein FerR (iron transport regulator) [Filimonas zeae]GGH63413.1 iron dicitrate transporter FecR [Filimonas zeae]
MNQPELIAFIFKKYLEGDTSPEVMTAITQVLEEQPDFDWGALMQPYFEAGKPDPAFTEDRWAAVLQGILQHQPQQKTAAPVVTLRWWRWAGVAAVLLLVAGTLLWQPWQKQGKQPATAFTGVQDRPPGKEGAVLTLADGTQVLLDTVKNGVVAAQQGMQLLLQNGRLRYAGQQADNDQLAYNTITTPKGRQFQVQLPDGSTVWLNAASSLRFPTRFSQRERRVEVAGEVYMEVAPDAQHPFRVIINHKASVEVLGTSFNIKAYDNEAAIQTTLVTGKVKMLSDPGSKADEVLLQPGQQAQLADGLLHIQPNADISLVLAWKNGLFQFDGADVKTVMRQIERWYDVEVKYEGPVKQIVFHGKMDRGVSLKAFIGFLGDYGLKATLEGRVLTITEKK